MNEVDTTWFRVQYLNDDVDDFEEEIMNFCSLISFLAGVDEYKLLKIEKTCIKTSY